MAAKLEFGKPRVDAPQTKFIVKPRRFKLTPGAQLIVETIRPTIGMELERINKDEARLLHYQVCAYGGPDVYMCA